mmetsp:Transcript_82699/g.230620  ORF Transcript_82699/g.230620 Transcript_82699/m.230620 type:complete len:336 (+) Transcript_82699:443-1450(+)
MHHPGLLHRLVKHSEGVVQRSLGLVQDVRGSAAEHDGARLALGAARELDHLVLADHDLFDPLARAELDILWAVEGRDDVRAEHRGEALGAVEVGVFDGHNPVVPEQLIGVVVNELPVDEDVAAMLDDLLNLRLHLLPLGFLNLGDCLEGVHLDASTVDFDLVSVHLGVGQENLAVFLHFLRPDPNLLFEDETLFQERILQRAARLLEHLDVVKVRLPSQPQDGVNCQHSEVFLFVFQQLRAEGGTGDFQQVLPERRRIAPMVLGERLQFRARRSHSQSVALDDDLRVHLLFYEVLGVTEHLRGQHDDGRSAITTLGVLRLGNIHKDLCGRVVDPH